MGRILDIGVPGGAGGVKRDIDKGEQPGLVTLSRISAAVRAEFDTEAECLGPLHEQGPIADGNEVRVPGVRGCRQNEVGSNTRGFSRGQYQFGEAV